MLEVDFLLKVTILSIIDVHYAYEGTVMYRISQQLALLEKYVKIYNEVRSHYSLNLMTPMEKYDRLILTP